MKHRFRFFAEKHREAWLIQEEEARHFQKVLRLSEADEIEVFNGQGLWAVGFAEEISKIRIIVKAKEEFNEDLPRTPLKILLGALKPKTFEDTLPALCELGCDELHIFLQDHTPKVSVSEKHQKRWRAIVKESCKQAKRPWFPVIKTWSSLPSLLEVEKDNETLKILLDAEAKQSIINQSPGLKGTSILIGSESGLSTKEFALASDLGFLPCQMTRHILRAKTAVIAAAAVMQMKTGD